MKKVQLPDKPSALIKVALADLRAVEKRKSVYKVDMGTWHGPINGKCHVCLAGAVVAMSLKYKPTKNFIFDVPDNIERKLAALDSFRSGWAAEGLEYLGALKKADKAGVAHDYDIPDYDDDPKGFKQALARMANTFEKAGL